MIKKAIAFATKAHEGQLRKGTTRPYIVHPLEVGDIIQTLTSDEEVICAAYLHDTIEDCGITEEILAREFTPRVARLVAQESEDKTKTWIERKNYTICHLKDADPDVQRLALADKLSNIRDISRDYPECGEALWLRFRMKSKELLGWYFRGVRNALEDLFSETDAYQEYCTLIEKIFGESEISEAPKTEK